MNHVKKPRTCYIHQNFFYERNSENEDITYEIEIDLTLHINVHRHNISTTSSFTTFPIIFVIHSHS